MSGIDDDVTLDPEATVDPDPPSGGGRKTSPPALDTMAATMATPPAAPAAQTSSSTRSSRGTRFEPGAIVAGRYRLVALLGKGGMGEVYRAEDLTLDQPVALKFLPPDVAAGDTRLSRFHNELRVARQVSHKNVCRLYDLGEVDGRRFLTMEYVDGEDLSSLLRRIGRIPQDKAVQIARQLCAGVAAAHERGVLHRDLKPANVMIDGQGDVRVTDFGIATAASSDATQEFIGTPHYMAPELFTGQPASVASDVYALGLTLYELFTGKRAYESDTLEGLKEQHRTGTMPTPSSLVRDLDPAVERIIVRCLEKDPSRRPASALAVAAALPGADALADALAAGETPSPAMVAAAAETDAIPVWRSGAAFVTIIVGLVVIAAVSGATSFARRAPLEKPPDVLVDRAETIVRSLGYSEPIVDRASGFFLADDYLDWIRAHSDDPHRWDILASGPPTPLRFWFRSGPIEFRAVGGNGVVTMIDPPLTYPNMRLLVLDSGGRLIRFRSVPTEGDPKTAAAPVDWHLLFDAAGLDESHFSTVASTVAPVDFADTRVAWEGPLPGREDVMLHVEGASRAGRPVAFWVRGPWTVASSGSSRPTGIAEKVFVTVVMLFVGLLVVATIVLARRHLASGRADIQGATRLSLWLAVPLLIAWNLGRHHAWNADPEIEAFFLGLAGSLLTGVSVFAMYLAIEPYVRRFWPHSLLGWSRLAAGHVRDVRIGYEVFAGMLGGIALSVNDLARINVLPRFGWPAPFVIYGRDLDMIVTSSDMVYDWVAWIRHAVQSGLLVVLLIVLLRLALRRNWLALPVAVLLVSLAGRSYMGGSGPWMQLFPLLSSLILVAVVARFGVLALVVAMYIWDVTYGTPLTLNVSHWSAGGSTWTLALLFAMATFAFYAARTGHPLFANAPARSTGR